MSIDAQDPAPADAVQPLAAAPPLGPEGTSADGATAPAAAPRRRSLGQRMKREWQMYMFIVPGVLFFAVFAYLPLAGNIVAFQDYSPFRGIFDSDWVGLQNFANLFTDDEVIRAVVNTLVISFLQIVFAFPAPIILALFLNSLISERLKRTIQTVVYLPHFISWVIVIAIWQKILGGAGPIAEMFELIGLHGVNIMTNPETFKILVVSQVIWKDVGWGTIIFFAAISSIPTELYESAATDGAGSWRRMWHITLPGLVPVISLLLILTVGNVLTVGFEQLLLQQPAVGANAAQVLDTFVYFRGVAGGDWGLSAAAGLLKGVIATVLVIGANRIAKRLGTGGIF
ncbi:ABC transporter permease [Brachybacterium paraconglomeratum]